jgi:hypothetical protein
MSPGASSVAAVAVAPVASVAAAAAGGRESACAISGATAATARLNRSRPRVTTRDRDCVTTLSIVSSMSPAVSGIGGGRSSDFLV